MKNLLKEYDAVKCSSQEEREIIVDIALKLNIGVNGDTVLFKKNTRYPNLIFSNNQIAGLMDSAFSGYKYHTPLQFIAKMVGVGEERSLKIANLEDRIKDMQKEIEQLKKQ